MIKKYALVLFVALLTLQCANNNRSKSVASTLSNSEQLDSKTADSQNQDSTTPKFVIPTPPSMLNTPEERMNYMALHFWDNYNFLDTALVAKAEITERALAQQITLLKKVDKRVADKSLKTLIEKAAADSVALHHFIDITEKYLYDPNSPVRDGELYISVLEGIISLDGLDDIYKIRPKYQLNMELKNRVGERATNINFTLESGKTLALNSVKAKYILLVFADPDCMECARVKQILIDEPLYSRNKELQIVTIYPSDNFSLWQENLNSYPKSWINGYDKKNLLKSCELYDLRAIPTLYLLSGDKVVLLKDATIDEVYKYLIDRVGK